MGGFARRVLLWIGAGVVLLVGIIMSVGVIPVVAVDPLAAPGTAIPSFWSNVIANVLVGTIMLVAVLGLNARRGVETALLGLAGIGAFVLGLFLLDTAFAFVNGGSALQSVVVALFACAGADMLAGMLAVVETVLRVRLREREHWINLT
ncbi:MAG TPA: hypothetical protein VFQ30_19240 [Ktedonobacteraceae bacterium]|nr:hypothetical protein [Ktedonobacteraceae bacterium]